MPSFFKKIKTSLSKLFNSGGFEKQEIPDQTLSSTYRTFEGSPRILEDDDHSLSAVTFNGDDTELFQKAWEMSQGKRENLPVRNNFQGVRFNPDDVLEQYEKLLNKDLEREVASSIEMQSIYTSGESTRIAPSSRTVSEYSLVQFFDQDSESDTFSQDKTIVRLARLLESEQKAGTLSPESEEILSRIPLELRSPGVLSPSPSFSEVSTSSQQSSFTIGSDYDVEDSFSVMSDSSNSVQRRDRDERAERVRSHLIEI